MLGAPMAGIIQDSTDRRVINHTALNHAEGLNTVDWLLLALVVLLYALEWHSNTEHTCHLKELFEIGLQIC